MRIRLPELVKSMVMKQALVDTQQTGIGEARQRVLLGQAWVVPSANNIQQGKAKRDNPGTRAIIQAGANTIQNSKAKS